MYRFFQATKRGKRNVDSGEGVYFVYLDTGLNFSHNSFYPRGAAFYLRHWNTFFHNDNDLTWYAWLFIRKWIGEDIFLLHQEEGDLRLKNLSLQNPGI